MAYKVLNALYTVLCARAVLYGLESTIATVSTSTTKYYVASTQPIGMRADINLFRNRLLHDVAGASAEYI